MSRAWVAAALVIGLVGCAKSTPLAAPPQQPARHVGQQSQPLVEAASGVYDLRFLPSKEASELELMKGQHRLTVQDGPLELRIALDYQSGSRKHLLTGLADEIDGRRWIAGLADASGEAPMVMHVTAVHADNQLVGSVVVDVGGKSFEASFVGTRSQAAPAAAEAADESEAETTTHYHLPTGHR